MFVRGGRVRVVVAQAARNNDHEGREEHEEVRAKSSSINFFNRTTESPILEGSSPSSVFVVFVFFVVKNCP